MRTALSIRRRTLGPGVRGAVLVESCTAVILLLLFLTCLIDLGRLVHHYVVLTQAANEAARLASRTPNLEVGRYPNNTDTTPTSHEAVHRRVTQVLTAYHHRLRLDHIAPITEYERYDEDSSSSTGMVKVEVHAEYLGFFPWFRHVQLNVKQTAEYLGKED